MENSKEKQIEEMASIINLPCSGHCEECPSLDCGCLEKLRAVSLYNAGYRKSTDLAEEIFAEIHNTLLKVIGVVDKGLDRSIRSDNEEAVKIHAGTLEVLKCLIPIFAELKKKYTESSKEITEEGK